MSRRWAFVIGQVVSTEKEVSFRVYSKGPFTTLPIGRYEVSTIERRNRYFGRGERREDYRYLLRALDRSNPLTREVIEVWEEELKAATGLGEQEMPELPLRLTFPDINRLAKDIAREHLRRKESLPEGAASELAGWLGETIEGAIHAALEMYDAGQLDTQAGRIEGSAQHPGTMT